MRIGRLEVKSIWGIALMAILIWFFWKKVVKLFMPKSYYESVTWPQSKVWSQFLLKGWIDTDGYFKLGTGQSSRYHVDQADSHALQLADAMSTSKRNSWYERIWNVTISPTSYRIKSILNPNYPASYRRYVIYTYADVYTNGRNLQSDARDWFMSILGISEWNNDLTKYFKL